MQRFQLLRWSGSVLSPRTRPVGRIIVRSISSSTPRWTSATATAAADDLAQSSDHDSSTSRTSSNNSFSHLPSPPPSAAAKSPSLAALHSRITLSPRLPLETLGRCLIHPSADPHPSFNNASLSHLGYDLLASYASELLLCKYPRLPISVLFSAMEGYVGPATLAQVVKEWGVEASAYPGGEVDPGRLQFAPRLAGNADPEGTGILVKDAQGEVKKPKPWNVTVSSLTTAESSFGESDYAPQQYQPQHEISPIDVAERPALLASLSQAALGTPDGATLQQAAASFARALVGAVYLHCGAAAARALFNAHLRARKLDVAALFHFRQPTRDLSRLCAREGFEAPIARVVAETGRRSRTPVFVVGVFSGREKLGEGTGASLDEARIRAAVGALKGWYLYSPLEVRVPSEAEGGGSGKEWEPVLIDGGEVVV